MILLKAPSLSDVLPDGLCFYDADSDEIRAMYRFRYIALPASAFSVMTPADIQRFTVVDAGRLNTNDQMIFDEMQTAFEEEIRSADADLLHESAHHTSLLRSIFWLYVNWALTASRVSCTRAVSMCDYSSKTLSAIVSIKADTIVIRQQMTVLEEYRLAREAPPSVNLGNTADRLPAAFCLRCDHLTLADIQKLYTSPVALWRLLTRGMGIIDGPVKSYVNTHGRFCKEMALVAFLRRHALPSLHTAPFLIARLVSPSQLCHFTIPLAWNGLFGFWRHAAKPGIKTFAPDGRVVSFDPGAGFAGKNITCNSLESQLWPGKISDQNYKDIVWLNYALDRYASQQKDEYSERRYETYDFLSRWLYGTKSYALAIRNIDRTVSDYIDGRIEILNKGPSYVRDLVMTKRRNRMSDLSDYQIDSYITSCNYHGV